MKMFTLIWSGQVVSMLGSGLTAFGLGVWVFLETGSVTRYALISFFAALAALVLSPVAGVLVDRWNRRRVLIGSDCVAGAATLMVGMLAAFDRLDLWHIYLLATLIAAADAFQRPAFLASVTLLVPREHLGRASGMTQAGGAATRIAAPVVAGALIVAIGLEGVVFLDVLTFLFAVGILLWVRIPEPVRTPASGAGAGLWREAWTALAFLRDRPGLKGLLLLYTTVNVGAGMVIVLLPPLVLSFAGPEVLGWVMSTGGVGLLVGALLVSAKGEPKRRIPAILWITGIQGAVLIVGCLRANALLIAAVAAVYLFLEPLFAAADQVIWQTRVPAELQGRVFAMRRLLAGISLPLAYLTAGPLADHVFEPLLAAGGALEASVGRILGVGPGRGIALLGVLLGLAQIVVAAVASLFPRLRHLEAEVPEAIPPSPPGSSNDRDLEA